MTISEQLRQAIVNSGDTHYRIWKETGVPIKSLDWFVSGQRPELRSGTIDRLCEYFGLELQPVKKGKKPARKAKEA